jgi:PAS domain S-box-containing protein
MKDEPHIVKQLREEELLGLLQTTFSYENKLVNPTSHDDIESDEKLRYLVKDTKKTPTKSKNNEHVREKYQTIFENYLFAITLVDNKERIVSWNGYTEELLNKTAKELYFAPVSSLYPPEEWEKIKQQNIRQKGIKYRMETKMLRKNHDPFDVEISLCILKSAKGLIVGSIGIIKDITKLKTTQRKLKESEEKYKTIFDNSAVAITISDEKERIVSWNRFTEDLLGLNKDDLYMKPVKSLYPETEWKKIRKQNVRQKGLQHCLETTIVKKNDEQISVNLSLSVIKNYDNKIIGSIGVIQDNSLHKKMEIHLKKSEQKYKQLYENAPIPYHTLSPEGIITNINKKWCQALGYQKNEVVGRPIFDFIDAKERKAALSSFQNKIKTCEFYTKGNERVYQTKSGEKKTFIIHDFLYFDNNKKVEFIQTTMEDITDRKEIEYRLKKSNAIIKELNKDLEFKVKERTQKIEHLLREKDEFINQLGHDLKTPLTPLVSLLPILETTEEDPKSKEILEVFHRNVDYMKNLVTKTIELARLNSANTVFEIQDLNLWEAADNSIQNQLLKCDEKNIKVDNKISKNVIVKADKLRLGELFNNLISNSLKYTPCDGSIVIDTRDGGKEITVTIRDTGIGMTAEQLDNVFNEFYKADTSRHDFTSSGLGLSICKRIVEKFGGKIWVNSQGVGKGSTFNFTLPKC